MVTRGNVDLMRYSLACYRRQTYPHRELVVVAKPEAGEKVQAFFCSELARQEDTAAIEWFEKTHRDLAYIDCPLLYVYAVTGRNTSGASHFEQMFFDAECVFEGDQFDELNELLSDRLPLLEYSKLLQCKRSCD
jgi:hypothetical protein